MRRSLPPLVPVAILLLFTMVFFRKSLIWGLVPAPFDLLVAWFFPYTGGGWTGEGNFLLYKGGHFASDAFRQLYLWRELSISLVKHAQLPLWNPYAFSGTPLIANLQSAVFYPLNLVFLLVKDFSSAWSLYIASAVLFGSIFMFVFLKSLKLGDAGALLGAIAFSASGYMIVWLEWGVIVHELLWLPLSLFAIIRWWESGKKRFLTLLTISVSSTIFAGYAQGAAYNLLILLTLTAFLLLETDTVRRLEKLVPVMLALLMSVGVTAIQWLPTAELYYRSAMRGKVSQTLSREAALPIPQLVTFLAPDFFGSRVTDDYWGKDIGNVDYMDADLFVGVGTVLLAVSAIISKKQRREVRWLTALFLMGIVLGTKTPITAAIATLNIPVVSTGGASEATLISLFAICCLAAFALDDLASRNDWNLKPMIGISGVYLFLIGITLVFTPEKAAIARNAIRLPMVAALLSGVVLFFARKNILSGSLVGVAFIGIVAGELLLHAEKILPFAAKDFVYPRHELFAELRERVGLYRIDGFWENEIVTNIETAYRLYSAEGYDPLYLRRYGEFVAAAQEGRLPEVVPRSDADITMNNETNRNRLIDLVSIKYIAAKVTDPTKDWEEEPLKYDPSRFKLVWQKGNFKIYENLHVLPRVKLYDNWQVIADDEKLIRTLYDPAFDPHQQIILEKDPGIANASTGVRTPSPDGENLASSANITRYEPNFIKIQTVSPAPRVLFLTDSFYPGWNATLDGNPIEVLRANYTFRSIIVPSGVHDIVFRYQPTTFMIGALVSTMSTAFLAASGMFRLRKKRLVRT